MNLADRMAAYLLAWALLLGIWGFTGELGVVLTCCVLAVAGRVWEWSRG